MLPRTPMLTIPNPARSLLVFGFGLWLAGCTPPGPRAVWDGKRLLDQGKYLEAVAQFKVATSLLPTNAVVWNYLGLAHQLAGQPNEALAAYQKALSLDRDLSEARFNRGLVFLEQNQPAAAKTDFTTYTLRRPHAPEGWLKLGLTQLRLREWPAAEKSLNEALRLGGANPEAWNALGLVHWQRGRPREAAQAFEAALKQQTNYAPAILNLAVVAHQQLNDRALALQKYRDYLALRPGTPQAETVAAWVRQLESELTPPAVAAKPAAPAAVAPPPTAAPPVAAPPAVAAAPPQMPPPATESPAARPAPAPAPKPEAKPEPPAVAARPSPAPTEPARVAPAPAASPAPTTSSPPVQVVELPPETPVRPAELSAPVPPAIQVPQVTAAIPPSAPEASAAGGGTTASWPSGWRRLNPATWFRREPPPPIRPTPLPPGRNESAAPAPPARPGAPEARPAPAPVSPTVAVATPSAPPRAESPPPAFPRYAYRSPAKPAPGNRREAERGFAQGVQAHQANRLAEAVQSYRMAIQADPAFFQAHYNLGLAAFQAGNLLQALVAYEYALAIDPDSPDARYNFALALRQAGYVLDAVRELENLLTRYPNDTRAHLAVANLYAQQLQQTRAARPHYLRVLSLEPRHPQGTEIRYWLVAHPE